MNKPDFKLILVDPNPRLCKAFEERFADLPSVEVVNDYFENLPEFDCMVSAANSFGLMDGGVDLAITNFFGKQLMKRVQQRIIDEFFGEQPVGTSIIVETNNDKHPFIAHTPTMRVPLVIWRTDHAYTAMAAMLRAVHHHNASSENRINVVACPGFGTATGRVSADQAARQMALAYRNYLNPPKRINWRYAENRHKQVGFGGNVDLEAQLPLNYDPDAKK